MKIKRENYTMARDTIHFAVKSALESSGWIITDDPLYLKLQGEDKNRALEVDLGAEQLFAAEKGPERIAVEVKTFSSSSVLNGFHEALGQYLDYRDAMQEIDMDRILFLAVSETTAARIENSPFIMRRIAQYGLKILVVDIFEEKIIEWKS
jgi:hypothetical protein